MPASTKVRRGTQARGRGGGRRTNWAASARAVVMSVWSPDIAARMMPLRPSVSTDGSGLGATVEQLIVGAPVVGDPVGEPVVGEPVGEPVVGDTVGEPVVGDTVGAVGDTVVGDTVGEPVVGEPVVGDTVVGDTVGDTEASGPHEAAAAVVWSVGQALL